MPALRISWLVDPPQGLQKQVQDAFSGAVGGNGSGASQMSANFAQMTQRVWSDFSRAGNVAMADISKSMVTAFNSAFSQIGQKMASLGRGPTVNPSSPSELAKATIRGFLNVKPDDARAGLYGDEYVKQLMEARQLRSVLTHISKSGKYTSEEGNIFSDNPYEKESGFQRAQRAQDFALKYAEQDQGKAAAAEKQQMQADSEWAEAHEKMMAERRIYLLKQKEDAKLGTQAEREAAQAQTQAAKESAAARERVISALSAFNRMGGQAVTSLLSAPVKFFEEVGNQAIRLSAIFYSFERLGRLAYRVGFGPVEDIVGASQKSRDFQQSIAGAAGGMQNAQGIDNALIGQMGNTPYTLSQARQSAQISSRVALTSPGFGLGSPEETGQQVAVISDIITRLGINNPEMQAEQIGRALQLYLEGNSRGVRSLGIDPRDAFAINKGNERDMAGQQGKMLSALEQIVRQRVPDSVVNQRLLNPEVMVEKIKDVFTVAMQRIGDSGLYQLVGEKLSKVFKVMFDYIQSSEFLQHASEIGRSVGEIFNGMGTSALRLLQVFSGAKSIADTPDAVVKQLQSFSGVMADFAGNLPGISASVGRTLEDLLGQLGHFASKANGMLPDSVQFHNPGMVMDAETGTRSDAIVARLNAMGLYGTKTKATGQYFDPSMNEVEFAKLHQDLDLNQLSEQYAHSAPKYGVDTSGVADLDTKTLIQQALQVFSKIPTGAINSQDESDYEINRQMKNWRGQYNARQSGMSISQYNADNNFFTGFGPGTSGDESGPTYPKYQQFAAGGGLEYDINNRLGNTRRSINDLAQVAPKADEQWIDILNKSHNLAEDITNSDLMGRLQKLHDAQLNQVNAFIKYFNDPEMQSKLSKEGLSKLWEQLAKLGDARAMLEKKTPESEVGKITSDARASIGAGMVGTFDKTKNQSAASRAYLFNQIASGNMLDQLLLHSGVWDIPPEMRSAFFAEGIGANMSAIGQSGAPASSSLIGGAGIGQQQLQYLQGKAMPLLSGQRDSALNSFNNEPTEKNYQIFLNADDAVKKLQLDIQKLGVESNTAMKEFLSFGNSVQSSLEQGTAQAFENIISNVHNFSEVLRNLAKSIVSSFAQMASKTLWEGAIGSPTGGIGAGNGIGGGIVGLIQRFSGMGGGPAGSGEAPQGFLGSIGGINGDYAGEAGPAVAMASGGTVSSPTLIMAGEAGGEAIIPLRGGKIPLSMVGGSVHAMLPGNRSIPTGIHSFAQGGVVGGGMAAAGSSPGFTIHNHTIIVDDSARAQAEESAIRSRDHRAVVQIVARDIMSGGAIRQAISQNSR